MGRKKPKNQPQEQENKGSTQQVQTLQAHPGGSSSNAPAQPRSAPPGLGKAQAQAQAQQWPAPPGLVQTKVQTPPGLGPTKIQAQPQPATASAWNQSIVQAPAQLQSTPIVQQQKQQPAGSDSQPPKPKVKGNKYPKKVVEPPPAPVVVPDLTQKMESLTVTPTKTLQMIESSPDGTVYQGTRGQKCMLEVNYLQIVVKNLIPKAFHYDVEFNPDLPKKMLPKALDKFMATFFNNVHFAFDGRKNFYTNKLLAVKGVTLDGTFEQEVEAVLGDRTKMFKVKVKFATEVDMSVLRVYQQKQFQHNDKPSQAIQCLDVILRTVFKSLTANNQAVAVGRALYFASGNRPLSLGEGMELWLGLFQSAVLGRSSLYLNVDVAHKAFPSAISIIEYLKSFDRDGRVPPTLKTWQEQQLHEYLKMLSISYRSKSTEAAKTFGYNGLVASAAKATFVDADGTKMTVQDYFEKKKKIRLQFPNLPCLHVGSKVRNIYLPLEFCSIPAGQATNKKCTPACVARMIKYSATSTDERKQKIQNLLNNINYARADGEVKGFGIDVDKNFQKVEGRVIDPPKIKYATGMVQPRAGVWNSQHSFIETQNEQIKWAIINCDERTNYKAIDTLRANLLTEARQKGMHFANFRADTDYFPVNIQSRQNELETVLEKCSKNGYRLVFVIITDGNDCYAQVKQAAELRVGILTQCIKGNTIYRMGSGNPMMTIGNIMLKVNAKLNGKNHEIIEKSYQSLNSLADGVMFVGADVTHPSPDQRDIPSVVGVAASHDQVGFRYQCAWRLQDPKKEIIEDLQPILTEQLKFYKAKNGNKLPGKIMYYRDGVSDGQFTEVLQIEMTAIRGAMKAVYGNQMHAKVTFVVVQKRHHTRFFPTDRRFSEGRNNNIMAGTVVDKAILHPFQYQFFMASHAAIQGVTKPTKYCVLVNESKISPDDLQAMTYDLCHLFTRCNRSVSYPAPTYYAHLVAARGKQYTIGARLNMMNLKHEFDKRLIRPNITNNCPMFFV